MLIKLLLAIAIFGTLTSSVYLALVVAGVIRFSLRRMRFSRAPFYLPGVSVLKAVHGLEPNLEENLESFFLQDYPEYELLFCARELSDPALQVARRLAQKHPQVRTTILVSGQPPWTNAKLYSLERMRREAAHDLFVISDSDVHAGRDYLREIMKPFSSPKVGMTTCMYRGIAAGGFWTWLEAMGFSVEMTAGVVVADMLEGMKFALGPTMVVRRQCVEALGGFGFMADYCADDFILGSRIAESGMDVVLSHYTIDHMVFHHSFVDSMRHQVRWMRSTRFSRPKGHLGTALTYAMPFGLLGLITGIASGHKTLGLAMLAAAFLNRIVLSIAAGFAVVRDRRGLAECWLYPVRDLLGAALWLGSYLSPRIYWRGEIYRLGADGLMMRDELPKSRQSEAKVTMQAS